MLERSRARLYTVYNEDVGMSIEHNLYQSEIGPSRGPVLVNTELPN